MVSSTTLPSTQPNVVVIGAGPAGCLLALLLAKQGAKVSVYDLRGDIRVETLSGNVKQRSISLSLSSRGISALDRCGLSDLFKSTSVPMYGRCVHKLNQSMEFHPYGQPEEHLLSISRSKLTSCLIDACDDHPFIEVFFNHECKSTNLEAQTVHLVDQDGNEKTIRGDLIVGADETHSRVREAMMRSDGFDFSKTFFDAMYKELPFTMDTQNGYPKEVLHIWPRGSTLLIALPNTSKTTNNFTATLFMPCKNFDALDTEEKVQEFFDTTFPDAMPAMPNVVSGFMKNPTQSLYTVRCSPFNFKGKAILIGDAAHTIVPFYGQGCNASLEDSALLAETIAKYGWGKLPAALEDYGRTRKPNADAIADLAIWQYQDMSTRSASFLFVGKRRLEIFLNWLFPSFFLPLYTMVSFSNMPYVQAIARAKYQDRLLAWIFACAGLLVVVALLHYEFFQMH